MNSFGSLTSRQLYHQPPKFIHKTYEAFKLVPLFRLFDEAIRVVLIAIVNIIIVFGRREDDHRYGSEIDIAFNMSENLPATHFRHFQI